MMYVGLPQWSHPKWVRLGITGLEEYARHFNCVEGNTTQYALPPAEILEPSRAGASKPPTISAFASNFRQPSPTTPHCETAMI
mgnify:CR=1 FL=1